MNNVIIAITAISLVIGIVLGIIVVWFIYLQRRNKQVDSLVRIDNLVGCSAIVEIPFDRNSQGKVRLNIKGSMVDLVAFTDDVKQFRQGDRVLIVGIKSNKVWVVSESI